MSESGWLALQGTAALMMERSGVNLGFKHTAMSFLLAKQDILDF